MRFVVDAHLPPGLCTQLRQAEHDALHTSQLSSENRTPDNFLNDLSLNEQRVVVTKDSDFYHSHLLHGKPWKLLLVRTGNIRAKELTRLFERHLTEIIVALEEYSLVELDWNEVRVII